MSGEQFWKTVVAGLIATYVMTMTGFWQSGLGLAALDIGAMITGSMTAAHPDAPYTLVAGNLVHFANGIIMGLVWVAFLQERVPGNWIVQGLVFAFIAQLGAWVVVAPLAFGAGLLDLSRFPWKNKNGVTSVLRNTSREAANGGLRHVQAYHVRG